MPYLLEVGSFDPIEKLGEDREHTIVGNSALHEQTEGALVTLHDVERTLDSLMVPESVIDHGQDVVVVSSLAECDFVSETLDTFLGNAGRDEAFEGEDILILVAYFIDDPSAPFAENGGCLVSVESRFEVNRRLHLGKSVDSSMSHVRPSQ